MKERRRSNSEEQLGKQHIIPDYRSLEETSKLIESEREITLKILKQSGMVK